MNSHQLKNTNSKGILIIIFCALLGFLVTFYVLNTNFVARSSVPPEIYIYVNDSISYKFDVKETKPLELESKKTTLSINPDFDEIEILFHRNPIFMVWAMLIGIMMTVAAGAFPIFIWQAMQLKKLFGLNKKQISLSILYALMIMILMTALPWCISGYQLPTTFIDKLHILLSSGNILKGIVISTMILEMPIIVVVFMIGFALDNISINDLNKLSIEKAASQFEFLNRLLQSALQVLAVIIIFSVLTSSALRQSINATITIEGIDIFPTETNYVYGLFFSLILGILYIPIYLFLKFRARQLKESLITSKNLQEFKDEKWFEKITGIINVQTSALDNLKLSLTVLAPLITSFLPQQLQIFK